MSIIILNAAALEPLGTKWPNYTHNRHGFDNQQIDDLKRMAQTYNTSGQLDHAIADLGNIDTTNIDAIAAFATDNGFTYNNTIGSAYDFLGYTKDHMPAWTQNNMLSTRQVSGVSGTILGYPIVMCINQIARSTTNNVPNISSQGVIIVELTKIFPQLVLDSNKNDKFGIKISSSAIKEDQKITLEGNFEKYFDFYAPKGINANSLSVLAPNFMQMLIDCSSTFDVEVYGSRLFMTTQDPLFTVKVMQEAIQALEQQLNYLKNLEQSWNYTPLSQPFDTLEQDRIANLYSVKIGPYRIGLLQLVLVFFGIALLISILGPVVMLFTAFFR